MADLRDNLKTHITLTKPKWKNTGIGHPTAYGYEGPNGRKDFMEEICLGQLNYSPAYHIQRFWIYNRTLDWHDPEISKKWLRWLLSPEESPWREIVRAQEAQDFDWVFDNAYILTNLDFASNWLVNFLTAWRLPFEKHNLVKLWDELVQAGASKGSAFTALGYVNCVPNRTAKSNVSLLAAHQGHFALSCSVSKDLSMAYRLNSGVPFRSTFLKKKFKDDTKNLPCNVVWSGVEESSYDYTNQQPIARLFWNMVETGKPEGHVTETKRMFVNPIRNPYERDVTRPKTATFETLLKYCLYLDSLTPGKDFPLNDC